MEIDNIESMFARVIRTIIAIIVIIEVSNIVNDVTVFLIISLTPESSSQMRNWILADWPIDGSAVHSTGG